MVWNRPPQERLTALDRSVIGKSKRISIPLAVMESGNLLIMKDTAAALRELATVMEIQSQIENKSEREALSYVLHEINHTNQKIKLACRKYDVELREGRPPDSVRLAQSGNAAGTEETVSREPVPHLVLKKV